MVAYKKEIDGIRGLAVLLVILFHFNVPWFRAGFIGVDIFFVVSGYLIGSIIWNDLEAGDFSFGKFYERRVRRILPALYTLIAVCLLISFLCTDNLYFKQLSKGSLNTVLFVSNIFFYRTTGGYFATNNGDLVMLHTWSLSVEEQLYIIFPVLLYLLHRYCKRYIFHVFLVLALASFVTNIIMTTRHEAFSFFFPATRFWEFLAGFFLVKGGFANQGKFLKAIISWAGLLCIIAGMILINKDTAFPGYHVLFPVAGTAALLFSQGDPSLIVNRIFSFQPLVFVGKISYSLYLWHWPVKLFSEYFLLNPHGVKSVILVLLIIALLSYLSWRFIETPFRRKEKVMASRRKLFIGFAGAGICLALISIYIIKKDGLPDRSGINAILDDGGNARTITRAEAYAWCVRNLPLLNSLPVLGDPKDPGEFLIWGDSQATALAPGFEAAAKESGKSGYIAALYTLPVLGESRYLPYLKSNVKDIDASILHYIATHPGIKKVFLCARWRFQENERPADTTSIPLFSDDAPAKEHITLYEGLNRTITALQKLGKKVVIICPLPELNAHPRTYLFQHRFFNRDVNGITPSAEKYFSDNKRMLDFFADLGKRRNVDLVPIYEPLFKNDRMILIEDNHLLYADYTHLSKWGAVKMKDIIKKSL